MGPAGGVRVTVWFTVQLDDRPGSLARVAKALAERGVNITGIVGVAEDTDGALMLTTSDAAATREAFTATRASVRRARPDGRHRARPAVGRHRRRAPVAAARCPARPLGGSRHPVAVRLEVVDSPRRCPRSSAPSVVSAGASGTLRRPSRRHRRRSAAVEVELEVEDADGAALVGHWSPAPEVRASG